MKQLFTLIALLLTSVTFGQEVCPAPIDVNSNGAVDIEDFLNVLGLFGDVDSDGDGIWDSQDLCTDVEACNYGEQPTTLCLYNDALGNCGGLCELDIDEDGVCDWSACGAPVTYQGHIYNTVEIGEQCWFAENLRSINYRNGDPLQTDLCCLEDGPWDEWEYTTNGAVSMHSEGGLYNGYAMIDERELCPFGWHIPNDEEWAELEMWLGMSVEEAFLNGGRGTDEGAKLKSESDWTDGCSGCNSSGFTALPGGKRWGFHSHSGDNGFWWTSTSNSTSSALIRRLRGVDDLVYRTSYNYGIGLSIRCIKGSE